MVLSNLLDYISKSGNMSVKLRRLPQFDDLQYSTKNKEQRVPLAYLGK